MDPTGKTLTVPAPGDPNTRRKKHFFRKRRFAAAFRTRGYHTEADALDDCHETEILAGCSHCGKMWYVPNKCRTRVCPLCSWEQARQRATFLQALCSHMKHPKLLTLTMPTWTAEPAKGIQTIRRLWCRMRHRSPCNKIVGGAYQVECVQKPNGWHIHIHILYEGPYIPRPILYKVWQSITNVPVPQVDIRAASDPQAQSYICKYATKSIGYDVSADAIVDWYLATKGQRLFATFGRWYKASLNHPETILGERPPPPPCPYCGATNTYYRIRDGPYLHGHDTWRVMESTIPADMPETRDLPAIKAMLATDDAPDLQHRHASTNQPNLKEDDRALLPDWIESYV